MKASVKKPARQVNRPLRSRSYLSIRDIIRGNLGNVLGDRALEYDEFAGVVTLGGSELEETDLSALLAKVEETFDADDKGMKGLQFAPAQVQMAVVEAAHLRRRHPVREYLCSLRWDGRPRFGELVRRMGADVTDINRTLIFKTMVAAVARAMVPGCKADTMLTLFGGQGYFKSTFFNVLAGDRWFTDSPIDIGEKDGYLKIQGVWISELAELRSLNGKALDTVKQFLTEKMDRFREPYGKRSFNHPRSCIFVGSTNHPDFLNDSTGERRFWPLRVGRIDLNWVKTHRDQLWAEAACAYRNKASWWLDSAEEIALGAIHEDHKVEDPWAQPVLEWMAGRLNATTTEILTGALEMKIERAGGGHGKRIGAILRPTWTKGKRDGDVSCWVLDPATDRVPTGDSSDGDGRYGKCGKQNPENSEQRSDAGSSSGSPRSTAGTDRKPDPPSETGTVSNPESCRPAAGRNGGGPRFLVDPDDDSRWRS